MSDIPLPPGAAFVFPPARAAEGPFTGVVGPHQTTVIAYVTRDELRAALAEQRATLHAEFTLKLERALAGIHDDTLRK